MGGASGKTGALEEATKRAETRAGKHTISGRYNRPPKRIEDSYVIDNKVLGTGYNGSVIMARSRATQAKYAVKAFKLHGVSKSKRQELEAEAEIFLSMDHPHVARLVDVYECEKHLQLVMECMEGGELFQRVLERKRFNDRDAADAAEQMLLAVNYIHNQGVVHRDLKLENFLYETKTSNHLKLIDFGFSHIWEPNSKMAACCGTLSYMAPEVLNKSYTSQCDLWSLGAIVFVLLLGRMPFAGTDAEVIDRIRRGQYHIWDNWMKIPEQARDFVKRLLVVDPKIRMTAEQALAHPWIKNRKKDAAGDNEHKEEADMLNSLKNFAEASRFRRACMSVMAWSLTNEERAKVRAEFIKLDKNKEGTICIGELKMALNKHFRVTDEEIRPIFEALDTSNSEKINYSEFLAAMLSTRIALHDDLLRATFKRFDADNSGFISAENLKHVLGESFAGTEVKQLMEEADLNGDGVICYDEFIAYLEGGHATEAQALAAESIIETEMQKQQKEGGDLPATSLDARPQGFLAVERVPDSPKAMGPSGSVGSSNKKTAKPTDGGGAGGQQAAANPQGPPPKGAKNDQQQSKACVLL
mmetsp:Transcript_10491/g.23835  ORF Transcript_10491/g.23835 Transcript_10491/m.23835 type:complete len:585 (-) Transcript_10491:34-1788(-)